MLYFKLAQPCTAPGPITFWIMWGCGKSVELLRVKQISSGPLKMNVMAWWLQQSSVSSTGGKKRTDYLLIWQHLNHKWNMYHFYECEELRCLSGKIGARLMVNGFAVLTHGRGTLQAFYLQGAFSEGHIDLLLCLSRIAQPCQTWQPTSVTVSQTPALMRDLQLWSSIFHAEASHRKPSNESLMHSPNGITNSWLHTDTRWDSARSYGMAYAMLITRRLKSDYCNTARQ